MKRNEAQIHKVALELADQFRKAQKNYVTITSPHYNYKDNVQVSYTVLDKEGTLRFVTKDEDGVFSWTEKELRDHIADLIKTAVPPKPAPVWHKV